MASINRTSSPSYYRQPPPASSSAAQLRRLMAGDFLLKPPRRWGQQQQQPAWRRSLLRLLLCFLLGFLLGLSPFADLDDSGLRPHHFSFDSLVPPPPPLHFINQNLSSSSRHDLASIIRPDAQIASSGAFVSVELEARKDEAMEPDPAVPRKLLIVITPTYNRALQAYHLNRLGQTLRLVPPPLLWVVVETKEASEETARILRRTGVMYRHLVCKKRSANPKDRGVLQRNTALKHIKHHHMDGIIYFADDDNIYSLELFERIREIRRFGTWPVAMLAHSKSKAILEGPVCNGSQVVGWHTNEKSKRLRRFHVDMSGFAFNSTILWDPKRWNRPTKDLILQLDTVKEGFQETTFIAQVVEDEIQMEGIPHGCTRIMNWHLHLDAGDLAYPSGWQVSKNLDVVLPLK